VLDINYTLLGILRVETQGKRKCFQYYESVTCFHWITTSKVTVATLSTGLTLGLFDRF